jgi:hypothetical protein
MNASIGLSASTLSNFAYPSTASPSWVYDDLATSGIGGTFTLTTEWLSFRATGAFGHLADDIPVAAIRGFFLARYRFVDMAGNSKGRYDELIVAWDERGARRRKKWVVGTSNAPAFLSLLGALAHMRPDANLMALPSGEAHRRLGIWSMTKLAFVIGGGIVGVVFVLVFGFLAFAFIHAILNSPG